MKTVSNIQFDAQKILIGGKINRSSKIIKDNFLKLL
jgi:hypothetical protein